MGTAKRERQKVNRQQRLAELAKEARRSKTRRVGVRVGLLITGVVVLVAGFTIFSGDDETATTTVDSTPTTTVPSEKPAVQIPDEVPTSLVVTDLVEGSGPAADEGDTLVVNYVGVRSVDGVEFDNSYDRGSAFPVTLGVTGLIQGWTDGLVGVQAGGQYQLDIPASLAYGDTGSGDVIRPGDAITFVVDIVSVTPAA